MSETIKIGAHPLSTDEAPSRIPEIQYNDIASSPQGKAIDGPINPWTGLCATPGTVADIMGEEAAKAPESAASTTTNAKASAARPRPVAFLDKDSELSRSFSVLPASISRPRVTPSAPASLQRF